MLPVADEEQAQFSQGGVVQDMSVATVSKNDDDDDNDHDDDNSNLNRKGGTLT